MVTKREPLLLDADVIRSGENEYYSWWAVEEKEAIKSINCDFAPGPVWRSAALGDLADPKTNPGILVAPVRSERDFERLDLENAYLVTGITHATRICRVLRVGSIKKEICQQPMLHVDFPVYQPLAAVEDEQLAYIIFLAATRARVFSGGRYPL